MNEEVVEVLKETKTLLDMIDSLASEDISDDLSDSLYDVQEVLENFVHVLENEAIEE